MKSVVGMISFGVCLAAYGDVVDKIDYEGLDRVEQAAIQDEVTIQPGKNFKQDDINQTIRQLYEKGFFSDIKVLKKEKTLVIRVKEKPMVDQVAFEGNNAATDDMLKHAVSSRLGSGKLYSTSIIKDVLSDIQLMYKALGYYAPVVKPQIIKHPGNKVDVVFNINEGEKTTVKKIIFIGNKTFSDDELKEVMSMKEHKVWRFWDYDSHVFREDKVEVDGQAISKFYKSHGFPFFMITGTHTEISHDKKSHYCTFSMEEGEKYSVGKVSLISKVDKVKVSDFEKFVTIQSNEIYDATKIFEVRDSVRKEVSLKEHPFVDVSVDIDYDKVKKTADIVYSIIPKEKMFVERIDIIGNVRTLDRVIRRELSVHEGDALNVYKIQKSVDRLKGMDYFEDVQVDEEEGSAPDKRVVTVKVKEKDATAQLRFGLNMSDSDGIGGFLGVVENNLFGTGRMLAADIMWMQRYYGAKVDIFDPRFFDQYVGAGIKFGGGRTLRKKYERSATKTLFVSPYIRYAINEHLSHRVGYSASFNKKTFWNEEAQEWTDTLPESYKVGNYTYKFENRDMLQDEYGKYTTCELSSVLTYADVDNPYDPRYGYDISLTNAYAGILGNVKYWRNVLEGNLYRPITNKVTFILNGQVGHLKEISNTRSGDRFTLGGGQTMRGFDSYGIGTNAIMDEIVYDQNGTEVRRIKGDSSVGSTRYWTASFMLKAPLSTKEMGINGVVFLDFGSAWGSKYPRNKINESKAIRSSAGVAIEWAKCPLGMPMSFIFGFALTKKSFDEKQTFTLSGMM
ncbi:MAG: outer membrane protein assembly factor BamA [Alphaproteobacteria bacterium]|nr:outer membrane protein assembly factor BamA [Alphaproteobacteria bacterium]